MLLLINFSRFVFAARRAIKLVALYCKVHEENNSGSVLQCTVQNRRREENMP